MKTFHRFNVTVAILLLVCLSSHAGTRRDDVSDSLHTSLAAQSDFDSVGEYLSGSSLCGANLIDAQWAITAAHCGEVGSVQGMTLEFDGTLYDIGGVIIHPNWLPNQNSLNGNDLALLRIAKPVSGVTPATMLTSASELNKLATIVGFGKTGDGLTGDVLIQGTKRAGNNVIGRFGGSGSFSSVSNRVLLMDFDRPGVASESSFGSSSPDALEFMVANKDSGGGIFINSGGMKLAGIVSFRIPGPTPPANGDGTADSDYGDISGGVRLSQHISWINDAMAPGSANWTGGTGIWNSTGNWNPIGLPRASDAVSLTQSGASVTHLSGETFIGSLSGNQSLSVVGGSLRVIEESVFNGTLNLSSEFGVSNVFTAAGTTNWSDDFLIGLGPNDDDTGIFRNAGTLNLTTSSTKQFFDGRIENSGTVVQSAGSLRFSDARFDNLASGTYEMQANIRIAAELAKFNNDGLFRRSGVASVLNVDISFSNNGIVEVESGTLRFTTDFDQSSGGELIIEIGGTGATQFGAVDFQGQTTVDGRLKIKLTNGFEPATGQTFQILTFDSLDGSFDSIEVPKATSNVALVPMQSSTDLSLRSTLTGDANFDDVVNFDDFIILSNNFDSADMTWQDGDFNFDTVVNFADFAFIANNFGAVASLLPKSNPEPASLALFTLAILALRTKRSKILTRA